MHQINLGNSMAKKFQGNFSLLFKAKSGLYLMLIYLSTCLFIGVSPQTPGLVVKLPFQGEIKGTFESYTSGGDARQYSAFRGIPYAKAPVGPLRFKDPEKHESWPLVRDASNFGSICPQWDSQGKLVGNEDCLFINIYTPMINGESASSANYPVMVYIHGGNFQKGSSNLYMQHRFIDNGIILVTFNYRLGVLGFLSTGDDACPGNIGLKDQVLALQWIQENIGQFGGSSSSVTLFGQGAGAVSTFLHILSPRSEGLFHQAITQSGSPICDWTVEEDPRSYANEVARRLRCSTKSSSAIVDCIRHKPLQEVLEAQKDDKTFGDYPLRAIPVIEREGFLPDSPAKLLESGAFKPVPLISGINKDDGAILYPLIRSYEDTLKKNSSFLLSRLIPMFLLTATDIRGNIQSVAQAIYFQYFNGIDSTNVTQVLEPFVNIVTDAMFVSCNYRTIQSYSAKGARVYMYTFEYKGEYSMLQLNGGNQFNYDGVSHGDELLYLFDMENVKLTRPFDEKKQKQMSYLWTTFVKTGFTPNISSGEFPKWEPYNSETKYYYKIDTDISRQSSYKQREIEFWLNHLPALSKIVPATDHLNSQYKIGGFGWTMFALAIILLVLLIAVTVKLLKTSKRQYSKTKTADK